jgi:hypothetical protein
MASQAVLFRHKKKLATEDCAFFYHLRKCKRSLAEIIDLAEQERNPDNLYHLVTCDDCRMHVQGRDPSSSEAEKVMLLCVAINRIEQMIERRSEIRNRRIQRNLARAQAR